MALFERNPSRRPSNSYSTATFVVFVALVLVGVWMLTSSTFTPASLPSESKSQTNEPVSETESIATTEEQPVVVLTDTQQEDTNTDTNPESSSNETENKKGEGNENEKKEGNGNESENKTENGNESENGNGNDSVSSDEQHVTQKVTEKSDEKIEEENSSKPSEDTNSGSESKDDTENKPSEDAKGQSENGTSKFDDENGKTEGGELVTPGEGTQELVSQNKTLETENASESFTEKTDAKGSEQKTSNDESNNSENDKVFSTETTTSENQLESNNVSGQETLEKELTSEQNNTDALSFPNGAQSELLNETSTQNGTFSTQAAESKNQKEIQSTSVNKKGNKDNAAAITWKLCNSSAEADYIPCLDNEAAIKKLRTTRHYEHRERHCPAEAPTCLVPLPEGYKRSIEWPHSRDKVV